MCGRFSLHSNPSVIALQFALADPPVFEADYNVAPTKDVLVVREDAAHHRFSEHLRWGLIPHWAKDPKIGAKLANARGETVAEKPSFRSAFRRFRCIVPASGFYEWKLVDGKKQPFYIRPADDGVFGFAGLTERWEGEWTPGAGTQVVRTCAIMTTAPNELMATIHDRMPVILEPEDYAEWLDVANHDAARLQRLIRPLPAEQMRAHPVSRRVNVVKNNDAANLEPVTL